MAVRVSDIFHAPLQAGIYRNVPLKVGSWVLGEKSNLFLGTFLGVADALPTNMAEGGRTSWPVKDFVGKQIQVHDATPPWVSPPGDGGYSGMWWFLYLSADKRTVHKSYFAEVRILTHTAGTLVWRRRGASQSTVSPVRATPKG